MKKRNFYEEVPANAGKVREAKTGEHCPLTGWWASTSTEGHARFFSEGSIMAATGGRSVTWKLVLDELRLPNSNSARPETGISIDGTSIPSRPILQRIPIARDGCEQGCHFCEGPETD